MPMQENPLSPEMLKRLKNIQLRSQRLTNNIFSGRYKSTFKGRGMAFEKVREYQPGDDVRHIDWHVTARMRTPYIKEYREEREMTVMLLVDVSASLYFGSTATFKSDIALEVAAMLAYLAAESQDNVGLILFSDCVECLIPPKKGRNHIWKMLRHMLTLQPVAKKTSIKTALQALHQIAKHHHTVFIISDFLDHNFHHELKKTALRHDVNAVYIQDKREIELSNTGFVSLQDAETGEHIMIDSHHHASAQALSHMLKQTSEQQKILLKQAGTSVIELTPQQDCLEPFIRFFKQRQRHAMHVST